MRVKILTLFLFATLFFNSPKTANASLLFVNNKKEVVWNVLSYTDERELQIPKNDSLRVKKIASNIESGANSIISIEKEGEGVNLSVDTNGVETSMDISGFESDIVEIEQRSQVQRAVVSLKDNLFLIQQENVAAFTDFPLTIDPESAEISVRTKSGQRTIAIMPQMIYENLIRAKQLDRLNENKMMLTEGDLGELQYVINGERIFNILNVYDYAVPISASVSASTGEVLTIDQPLWVPILGILFS